jgi:hypothetical protein
MRGFARNVLSVIAAVSLLLCVATVVLWVRSYSTRDAFGWAGEHREGGSLHSYRGSILYTSPGTFNGYEAHPAEPDEFEGFSTNATQRWEGCGFAILRAPTRPWAMRYELFVMPDWFLVLLQLAVPLAWLIGHRRRRRRARSGLCSNCSYDLRASRDRCPECGMCITARSHPAMGTTV